MIKEMSMWRTLMRENNVRSLNEAIVKGNSRHIINLSETLHDHKYADIANSIAGRPDVKLVLIAGPSSSGKTTSSKRLALHMRVNGLNPIIISMDDYFKEREETPKDANGDYDFESINALDLDLLNKQLTELFAGREVEIPKFDFAEGKKRFNGDKLRMREGDVLIMEGIHGLNPTLTGDIPSEQIFKIYVAVLTPIIIDGDTKMVPSDYRLLRRIVRDSQFRGTSPAESIMRWPSVLRGEADNILPFKSYADVQFNSALMYELAMMKSFAEPRLQTVPEDSPAHNEVQRLLDTLRHVIAITPDALKHIPAVSVIREFIGGSSFSY